MIVDFCVDDVVGSLTYDDTQNAITCTGGGARYAGVQGAEDKLSFRIYPNPTSRSLNIDIPGFTGSEVIKIVDLAGVERISVIAQSANVNVSIESLARGTYILKLYGEDYQKTEVFIKQ